MKVQKQLKKRSLSLSVLIISVMIIVLVVIAFVFAFAMRATQISPMLKASVLDTLTRSVLFAGNELQNQMTNVSTAGINLVDQIEQTIDRWIERNELSARDFHSSNNGLYQEMLNQILPHMLDTLKLNVADGLLVVLDGSMLSSGGGIVDGRHVSSVYLKDQNLSSLNANYSDLMMMAGPKYIARELNIPLDNYWEPELSLDGTPDGQRIFTEVMETAKAYPLLGTKELGCWYGPVHISGDDTVMTYVLPLVESSSGRPYGVVGIELSETLLKKSLGTSIFRYQEDSLLALIDMRTDDFLGPWLVSSGIIANRFHVAPDQTPHYIGDLREFGDNLYEVYYPSIGDVTLVSYPLNLYYSNSPYQDRQLGLIGGVFSEELYGPIDRVMRLVVITFVASIISGLFCVLLASRLLTHRLTRLGQQVGQFDPDDREYQFSSSGIAEIDGLIGAIEQLRINFEEVSDRLTDAINMTGMPIGFIELNLARDRVFVSDLIFKWFGIKNASLGIERAAGDSAFIPVDIWNPLFDRLMERANEDDPSVHPLDFIDDLPLRWVRVKHAGHQDKTFYILTDVTREIMERKDFEYQRDFDPLTGLLNRRAFFTHVSRQLANLPGKKGAVMFMDLDNLKSVNDTYGHEYGDRYIRDAAIAFRSLAGAGQVVARFSGDEFAVFLYGFDSYDDVSLHISKFQKGLVDMSLTPDDIVIRIRCSIGVARYPADSSDIEQLIKFADFSMYEVKRTNKGTVRYFDPEQYSKNAFLLESSGAFNQFIEKNEVSYAFQPIVNARTGEVFAYEALMRPMSEVFKSPTQVLDMAKAQAKMYLIEKLTCMNVFRWVKDHQQELDGRNIFFNSIADQILVDDDFDYLKGEFGSLFPNIVVEITESERYQREMMDEKCKLVRDLGGRIAIDDFGSGYSNDLLLLITQPDYIKIDIQLVSGLDMDTSKLTMVRNIVSYAKTQGWMLIAEGVERKEEAEVLIGLGVDYLQGYYLQRPSFELTDIDPEVKTTLIGFSKKYAKKVKKN